MLAATCGSGGSPQVPMSPVSTTAATSNWVASRSARSKPAGFRCMSETCSTRTVPLPGSPLPLQGAEGGLQGGGAGPAGDLRGVEQLAEAADVDVVDAGAEGEGAL